MYRVVGKGNVSHIPLEMTKSIRGKRKGRWNDESAQTQRRRVLETHTRLLRQSLLFVQYKTLESLLPFVIDSDHQSLMIESPPPRSLPFASFAIVSFSLSLSVQHRIAC